jgi:hypothetical protein
MIGEQGLKNIIRAADPDDRDDVATRKLLVSAFTDISADLTELLHDPQPAPGQRSSISPPIGRHGAEQVRTAPTFASIRQQ